IPSRARSSADCSSRSLPSNRTSPCVTSYVSRPASTWASVLLPDPFLPMIAWTSPALIVRSTPLRISRPFGAATRAWRLEISSIAMFLNLLSACRSGACVSRSPAPRAVPALRFRVQYLPAGSSRSADGVVRSSSRIPDRACTRCLRRRRLPQGERKPRAYRRGSARHSHLSSPSSEPLRLRAGFSILTTSSRDLLRRLPVSFPSNGSNHQGTLVGQSRELCPCVGRKRQRVGQASQRSPPDSLPTTSAPQPRTPSGVRGTLPCRTR